MHVYFSGIGGSGIAPLALIAKQAGYQVSGSDGRPSQYLEYLKKHGIADTHMGVDRDFIAAVHAKQPIDWFVYGSAQPMDFPDHPEFAFCQENHIKISKRDEFLSRIITDKKLKLIAVAGTHGKTTATAMAVWLFKQLGIPVSYSVGGKINFGETGQFDPASKYFVYEADEYDRNFLSFYPEIALIAGIDWDHPDIYPSREEYYAAFRQFLSQSRQNFIWRGDAKKLAVPASDSVTLIDEQDPQIDKQVVLAGHVNRLDAWLVTTGLVKPLDKPAPELVAVLNKFPGLARRFEQLAPNLYTDYAHTPAKIRGALQMAREILTGGTLAGKVVVVYEGLHNTRQHFIKDQLADLFDGVKQLYIVPSYLAREDPKLELLTPEKILDLLSNSTKGHAAAAQLNDDLASKIRQHTADGDLVLCFSAGSGDSLDEWLRKTFAPR